MKLNQLVLGLAGISVLDFAQAQNLCSSPVKLTGNPFVERVLHPNSIYQAQVEKAWQKINDTSLQAAARKVVNIGSFLWLEPGRRLQEFDNELENVPCSNILGIVVKNLARPLCTAVHPEEYWKDWNISSYKSDYIDEIARIIREHPDVAVAAIIEPGAVGEIVVNSDMKACDQKATSYREGIVYALKALNLDNVMLYLDAAHGGVLGWRENVLPAKKELTNLYEQAGRPKQFRGFATNVANYNGWDLSPGEFESTRETPPNKGRNEKSFVELIATQLANASVPNHAITDTSRSAVQGLRVDWGSWCNVNGAGFGIRPTNKTGNKFLDAFVWAKNGGISDGTTDVMDAHYDSFCGRRDAFKPSPPAGEWNQAYFEDLVRNAKPSF